MKFFFESVSSFFPYGASYKTQQSSVGSWNFSIYSKEPITHIIIQDLSRSTPPIFFPLFANKNKTADIWHCRITTAEKNFFWCWGRGNSEDLSHFVVIQDPYAKLLDSKNSWGNNIWRGLKQNTDSHIIPLAVTVDWEKRYEKHTYYTDSWQTKPLIIYEMHIRGFTKNSLEKNHFVPGTFQAATQKLYHLKKMGITAVELLPIAEWNEAEWQDAHTTSANTLYNYWGYSPLNFFSPCGRLFSTNNPLEWVQELQQFIDTCHKLDMYVIVDVVFNHTGEGNHLGPAYSWKHVAADCYYLKTPYGDYLNYSGCGNTVNANHPLVADMIVHALHHWVLAYNVDGFRFDLASCLLRGQSGAVMNEPYLIEKIVTDPILSKTILIAEPWDAAGLYHTGHFHSTNQQNRSLFLEWNDRFRDDVRKFIKGDKGMCGTFATRLCGSQDIYHSALSPRSSINYVTAHDGFSLQDLVSYNTKYNKDNGEHNNDGMNENYSWNCGNEGETADSTCAALRCRQIKNFFVALIFAHGTPMILMADEYGHTKYGNNNAWCQDNITNWFDWNSVDNMPNYALFIRTLIEIRIRTNLYCREKFLSDSDIQWHGKQPNLPDWSYTSQFLAYTLLNENSEPVLYIAFSAEPYKTEVAIPPIPPQYIRNWYTLVDTGGAASAATFYTIEKAPKFIGNTAVMAAYSSLVLLCR